MSKKIILIVIDGLGDEPIPALSGKTPLEAANTPNFDFLAKNGICGLVLPWCEKGKLPTSEDTHFAIFGYDPKKSSPGRGVLADFIKAGAPARGERVAKYNRLLRIEEELQSSKN